MTHLLCNLIQLFHVVTVEHRSLVDDQRVHVQPALARIHVHGLDVVLHAIVASTYACKAVQRHALYEYRLRARGGSDLHVLAGD